MSLSFCSERSVNRLGLTLPRVSPPSRRSSLFRSDHRPPQLLASTNGADIAQQHLVYILIRGADPFPVLVFGATQQAINIQPHQQPCSLFWGWPCGWRGHSPPLVKAVTSTHVSCHGGDLTCSVCSRNLCLKSLVAHARTRVVHYPPSN